MNVAISPKQVVAISEGKFFDVQGVAARFVAHSDTVTGLCYSADGLSLASVGHDGKLVVWNTSTWKQRANTDRPDRYTCVAFPKPTAETKPYEDTYLSVGATDGKVFVMKVGYVDPKKK